MKKIKDNVEIIILAIVIILVLVALGFSIYAMLEYGNKPITEVPFWAIWLMHRK